MAVSEATAAKAVKRWELEGGLVSFAQNCRCRYWSRPDPSNRKVRVSRQVYYCPEHRYRGRL